jgi:hypothetical protein
MIIAVDFDGTIVEHQFPEIGQPIDNAFEALLAFKDEGHKLILWTCRNDEDPANKGRKVLTEAVAFCRACGLEFDAVNANVPGLGFNPAPKVYADMYIDDRSQLPFWEMFSDGVGICSLPYFTDHGE